jgi:predicted lipoprotein with Yx(FWY)xxD motif
MQQSKRYAAITYRIPCRRLAVTAFAVGGLFSPVFLGGTADAATNRTATSVIVSTATNAKVGKILVSGKTLYALKASTTPCVGACVKVWPELVLPKGVTKATAGKGVSASKLGTVTRPGGVLQVTYSGKPLYWFSGDTKAGQVNGDVTDTWGKWSAVVIKKSASSGTSSGGSSSGTGGTAF